MLEFHQLPADQQEAVRKVVRNYNRKWEEDQVLNFVNSRKYLVSAKIEVVNPDDQDECLWVEIDSQTGDLYY